MKVRALPPGVFIATLAELGEASATVKEVACGGATISLLLTRRGSAVAAFRNRCPHAGYPLQRADGRVLVQEGRYLVCAAHGASFQLESGACAGGPCDGDPLEQIAVLIDGGAILSA